MIMVLFQQQLWKYSNQPGVLYPVDRGMVTTSLAETIDLSKQGFQVEVHSEPLQDVRSIDAFAKAIGYDNGTDFYVTWRLLQRKERITEFKLTHYTYQDMLNAVTLELRGKWCDLCFDDLNIVHSLYRCEISRKHDYTKITFGI